MPISFLPFENLSAPGPLHALHSCAVFCGSAATVLGFPFKV